MATTKKSEILKLYSEGYEIKSIIEKGFTKKYVMQVLKEITKSNSNSKSADNSNIAALKQLTSTIENLQSKYNQLNINIDINISIKVNDYNDSSNENKTALLNPVTTFRSIGEDALKEKLITLPLEDLIKISKTYTPDFSGKIYKRQDAKLIIEYIIERASSLSKVGQVFRNISNSEQ